MKEKEITKEWLESKGFKPLFNVSYNAYEVTDEVYLCVDLGYEYDSVVGEQYTDVAIGLYCTISSSIVPLELYSMTELKALFKLLTGSKL